MNDELRGKRFYGFCITAGLLFLGLIACLSIGNFDGFGEFTLALGAAFGAFAAGQSWTDNTEAKHAGP